MAPSEQHNDQPEPQQDQAAPPQPSPETVASMEVAKRPMMEVLSLLSSDADLAKSFAREVVSQEVARAAFDQDWRLAKVFAMSGVFSDIKGSTEIQAISTAMAKIQLGRCWNLTPSDSMQFIYFTNGRPAIMQELFAAKLRDAGYDWDIAHHYSSADKKKCVGCTIYPKRWNPAKSAYESMMTKVIIDGVEQDARLEVSFTKDDADNALIWEKGKQIPLSQKWNFVSWAKDMYFWRALSRFRRQHATNVLSGVLLREEAEDIEPAGPQKVPARERAVISMANLKPSADENRGHDATQPTPAPTTTPAPQSTSAPAATSTQPPAAQQTAEPPQQQASVVEPPDNLPHYIEWPDSPEATWMWVGNELFYADPESGNYKKHSDRPFQVQQPRQQGSAKQSGKQQKGMF